MLLQIESLPGLRAYVQEQAKYEARFGKVPQRYDALRASLDKVHDVPPVFRRSIRQNLLKVPNPADSGNFFSVRNGSVHWQV